MIPAMNSCKKEKYIGIRLSEKEYQMVKREAEHDPDCRSKSGTINISKFIRNRVLMPERNAIRVERKMEDLIFQIRKIGINIHQTTRKMDSEFGELSDIQVLQEEQKKIENLLKELIQLYARR